jgi:hypothetical protein
MNEARGRLEVAVQHEGVEVGTVGPYDGPQFVVYANLRKEVGVGKWLEHGAVQLSCEIDITRAAIAEADPEPIVAQHLRGCDPHEVHRIILRQRVNWLGSAAILCARPVCFEFAAVQSGPLCDEFERARRQITDQHLAAPAACCASHISIPWEAATGLRWAELLATLRAEGHAMPIKDSFIAATVTGSR